MAYESKSRSFAKATSWRITGTIDTIIIASFISGSITFGVTIGATEFVTKIVLYWIHERVWNKIKWGYQEKANSD